MYILQYSMHYNNDVTMRILQYNMHYNSDYIMLILQYNIYNNKYTLDIHNLIMNVLHKQYRK